MKVTTTNNPKQTHLPRNPRSTLQFLTIMVLFSALFTFIISQKDNSFLTQTSNNIVKLTSNTSSYPPKETEPKASTTPEKPSTGRPNVFKKRVIDKENIIERERTSAWLIRGGTVPSVNMRLKYLCKLAGTKDCYTNYIADSIDLAVAFAPLYAVHQDKQEPLYELHEYFIGMMNVIGIKVQVLEAIIKARGQVYKKTRPNNEPWEMQIEIDDTFYYRENLLNVAARKTYDLWEYMFWIDAHQVFQNLYWWEEAIYKLEHYNAVHFTQHMKYMDAKNVTTGWGNLDTATYQYRLTKKLEGTGYFAGNGWGMRQEVYKKIDFILDYCIAGACDYSLIYALLRSNDDWNGISIFPHYFEELKGWIDEKRPILNGSYANIRGDLYHIDHPHFLDYFGVQRAFSTCCFDHNTDLYRDENFTLHSANDQLKKHFQ